MNPFAELSGVHAPPFKHGNASQAEAWECVKKSPQSKYFKFELTYRGKNLLLLHSKINWFSVKACKFCLAYRVILTKTMSMQNHFITLSK